MQVLRLPHCDDLSAAALASAARVMRAGETSGDGNATAEPLALFQPLSIDCPLYARKFDDSVVVEMASFFEECGMLAYAQECLAHATPAAVPTGD
jgi:hypothetical protein